VQEPENTKCSHRSEGENNCRFHSDR
jgi:hypothetical protein